MTKIAIHDDPKSYSRYWIEACKRLGIEYKVVNAYDSNIVEQLQDCTAFMWHFAQTDYKAMLFAKPLLNSLPLSGIRVFPDWHSSWHFDDKLAQKYLLEAAGLPLVRSYAFYSRKTAMDWVGSTTFPKVFKLRGGSGSRHVKLVKTPRQAKALIRQAFGRGFPQYDKIGECKERFRRAFAGQRPWWNMAVGLGRLITSTEFSKMHGREKGYVYFQDFIPGCTCDFRIKVVNGICWGFRRGIRKNDFRASGSGIKWFEQDAIPPEMIALSFRAAKLLQMQSVALDFVLHDGRPEIVELSYGFGFDDHQFECGYWTEDMARHEERFDPFEGMVRMVINP